MRQVMIGATALLVLGIAGTLPAQKTASGKKTYRADVARKSASNSEPITLSVSDLYPGKGELLEQAREMKAKAEAVRDSVDYAAEHKRFQRAVSVVKPPVAEWNADERELIASVPEPTESARNRYEAELKAGEEKVRRDVAGKERAYLAEQKQRERELTREEQLRRDRVAEAQRWAEVDALHRQADALEDRYYPYYGPVIFHPHKPGPVKPPVSPTPRVTPAPGPGIIPW